MDDSSSILQALSQPPLDIDTAHDEQRLQLASELEIIIALFIVMMFPFFVQYTVAAYADKAFDPEFPERQERYRDEDNIVMILEGFWEALYGYEIPLIVHRVGQPHETVNMYTVKVSEARMFLRDILEPPPWGVFNFLELPAELRNRIYEELLVFPGEDGLTIVPKLDSLLMARSDNEFFFLLAQRANGFACPPHPEYALPPELGAFRRRDYKTPIGYHAPSMQSQLAILSVSHQNFKEAAPIFYGQNHFRFHSMAAVGRYLADGPQDRTKLLTKITISLDAPGMMHSIIGKTVNALWQSLQLKELKELNIGMYKEQKWLKAPPQEREKMGWTHERGFKTFEEIPSMLQLAEVLHAFDGFDIDQKLQGNCIHFKGFLEEQFAILDRPGDDTPGSKKAQAKKEKAKEARAKKKAASEAATVGS